MNIKFPLNDLMLLVNKAETSGRIKEAISLIETHIDDLEPYEKAIVTNVKEYLQKKLPQTATEVSARVQVEMSAQLNRLKSLFSRINKETIIKDSKEPPVDRSEWSMMRENLEKNLGGLLHPQGREFWLNKFYSGELDGLTGKAADLRFMQGAQRLVDLGIIDNSTLVIIHTGHNIPIAKQLSMNQEKLGNVNGVLEFSRESFPELKEKTAKIIELFAKGKGSKAGFSREETEILRKKIEPLRKRILYGGEHEEELIKGYLRQITENTGRISNQEYTYPGTITQKTEGKGAKFLGLDFHRTGRIDTSKLPTAKELKEAGIKKVVFLEEAPPLSSFSPEAADKLYEPMTREKASIIANLYDSFVQNMYQRNIKSGLSAFAQLERILTPQEITQKIKKPTVQEISTAQAKAKSGEFGYKIQHVTREDILPYLQDLAQELPFVMEGVDVNKLEQIPYQYIAPNVNDFVARERAGFNNTLKLTDVIIYIENLLKQNS